MNVGIIGVGPWGRTVAAAFERAGHVVTAHDRHDKSKFAGDVGELVPWRDMISGRLVDAVVCTAPPDVTRIVFDVCQARRMPCLLTKPFLISNVPRELSAPVFVDYVHLASPVYERLKKNATVDYEVEEMEVTFCGNGPDRSFPGLLDYGAHALSIVHDILGLGPLEIESSINENLHGRDLFLVEGTMKKKKKKKIKVKISTGNGASGSKRRVEVSLARGPRVAYDELSGVATFEIDGKLAVRMPGHDPLAIMIDRFAWDVDAGRINPYFVELSAAVTRSLAEIRRVAERRG